MNTSNLPGLTPPVPPKNPLKDGTVGQIAVILTVGGLAVMAIFFGLDTIQFIVTGKESQIFHQFAVGFGTIGVGSLVVTLLKSYLTGKDT